MEQDAHSPGNTRPVYLIDGFGLIFRAYYALMRTPMRSPSGMSTTAVFGFFRILASFIKNYRPHTLVVALESRGPTFRDDMYPEYKATRQATPEDLKEQFPWIERILEALGMPLLRCEGYEADDVMATFARICREQDRPCIIVSADKDMLQLVGDGVSVLRPAREGSGFEPVGPDEVFASRGVRPDQILDYLSLLGDSADNVPGVKGIGEKGAAKLLSEYGNLDGIYGALESIPGATGRKLAEGRDMAYFSRDLVRLCDRVPLPGQDTPDFWTPWQVASFQGKAAAAILKDLGIGGLSREIGAWGGDAPAGSADIPSPGNVPESEAPGPDAGAPGDEAARAARSRLFASPGAPVAAHGPEVPGLPRATGPAAWAAASHNFFLVTDIVQTKDWVRKALAAGRAVVDTETEGLDPHRHRLCGVSLSLAPGEGAYLALRGPGPDGLPGLVQDEDAFREAVRPLFETPGMKLGGHNLKFDWQVLASFGLNPVDPWFDTMIAAWILDTTLGQYNMDYLARICLGYETITFDSLFADLPDLPAPAEKAAPAGGGFDLFGNPDPAFGGGAGVPGAQAPRADGAGPHSPEGAGDGEGDDEEAALPAGKASRSGKGKKTPAPEPLFSRVPLDRACIYSSEDSEVTFRLWNLLEPELASRGLDGIFRDMEMPLVPLLARMEWQGMAMDARTLQDYSVELELRLRQVEEDIYRLVGHPFNIASTKQLQEVLFTERKLQGTKKTKTGWSTDTSVLEELALEDPVPEFILRYRGLAKLKSTYADALPRMVNPVTGRVHTSLVQTGTATGRLSSKDPNLQNIPIRDEDGRRIRSAFVAPAGTVLVSADYAQIELVLLAHFARDPGLCAAFREGVDVHRATAALIFGIPPEEVDAARRRAAKTINFGVMYGMSAFRLARELGIPRGQAQSFIDAYFATYSGIKTFVEAMAAEAREKGGVRTLAGRFRPVPDISSRNANIRQAAERIAVNTPIQGSGADIVKTAMLQVDRALREGGFKSRLILQVHDELILECPVDEKDAVMTLLERTMAGVARLEVPLRASVEAGATWGEMHA